MLRRIKGPTYCAEQHAQVPSLSHRDSSDMSALPPPSAPQTPADLPASTEEAPLQVCAGEGPGDLHAAGTSEMLPNISSLSVLEPPTPSTFLTTEDFPNPSTATYYDLATEDRSSEDTSVSEAAHPGYPWVRYVEGGTGIEIPDECNRFHMAPFVRFGLLDGEPTIWGTDGGEGEITQYAEPLHAKRKLMDSHPAVDDSDVRCFESEQIFTRAKFRAAEILGDFGILAEIYRLQ